MIRKTLIVLAALLAFQAGTARAQISDGIIKIGVLNDQSGLYADLAGPGSVVAARRIRFEGRSLGRARLNGISSSPDHSRIWLTYVGKLPGKSDPQGGVLELPAF